MNEVKIEEFDNYTLEEVGVQFIDPITKKVTVSSRFGCIGKITAEAEVKPVQKKCEGIVVDEKVIPTNIKISIEGHVQRAVLDEFNGLSNDGLKKGVYAYGINSTSRPCIITGVIYDLNRVKKLIAFPNVSSTSGLKFELENNADEVAQLTLDMNAKRDENGKFYYQAFEQELDDATVKADWLTNFSPSLVKLSENK